MCTYEVKEMSTATVILSVPFANSNSEAVPIELLTTWPAQGKAYLLAKLANKNDAAKAELLRGQLQKQVKITKLNRSRSNSDLDPPGEDGSPSKAPRLTARQPGIKSLLAKDEKLQVCFIAVVVQLASIAVDGNVWLRYALKQTRRRQAHQQCCSTG